MRGLSLVIVVGALFGLPAPSMAQLIGPESSPLPVVVQAAPVAVTKLEGFRPAPGAIMTIGHEILGGIRRGGVVVEVRDVRDSQGNAAGGLTVLLTTSNAATSRFERTFIDVDELPGVLKSLDALLKYTANPTPFKKFEARFVTRGNLSFVAYANTTGNIEYALQVDEVPQATVPNIESVDMLRLRELIELGLQKLNMAGYGAPAAALTGSRR
jgi:hypothetical protein